MTLTVNINKSNDFVRPQRKGDGWIELGGDLQKSKAFFSKLPSGDRVTSFKYNSHSYSKSMHPATLLEYTRGNKIVALAIIVNGAPQRVFRIANNEAAELLKAELVEYGTLKDQYDDALLAAEDMSTADKLYSRENELFNEAKYFRSMLTKSTLSLNEARKDLKNSKIELLSKAETVSLIQIICDEYSIQNLEISIGGLIECDAHGMATMVNFPLSCLPTKLQISIRGDSNTKHIVLHEMAHIIEYWQHGQSGHGGVFQKYYNELLKKHHKHNEDGSLDVTL